MTSLSQKIASTLSRFKPAVQFDLEGIMKQRSVSKGTFLLESDDVCRNCFILENGIARKFIVSNDKEITTELYFTDDVAVSLESFSQQTPSKEWIEVLTDSVIQQLNFQDFQQLKSKHPELIELDLIITEHYSIWMEHKLMDFRTKSATERYQELMQHQPHYIQHIPLTIIASYLGVALETLSRIRAKR